MCIKKVKMNRSYTITSPKDRYNVENGRCPDYALAWSVEENAQHWDPSHNFYLGNGYKSDDPCFETVREILNERRFLNNSDPIIYCDLDGVLVDFERGVLNCIGKSRTILLVALCGLFCVKRLAFMRICNGERKGVSYGMPLKNLILLFLQGALEADGPNSRNAIGVLASWDRMCVSSHVIRRTNRNTA